MSSELSKSEDDKSAQCSNLQTIGMVENESLRLEKEHLKRKSKRYSAYGRLRGRSTFINNHWHCKIIFQRAVFSCQSKGERGHVLSYARTSMPLGMSSRGLQRL